MERMTKVNGDLNKKKFSGQVFTCAIVDTWSKNTVIAVMIKGQRSKLRGEMEST